MQDIFSKNFRTKTIFVQGENPHGSAGYEIGLDVGYSGVKTFTRNKYFSFPMYAKEVSGEQMRFIDAGDNKSILYQADKNSPIWSIGADSQNLISLSETEDSNESMYGRNRYFSPMFKIVSEVAIALALRQNKYGGYSPKEEDILIQTGLPSNYMSDKSDLIESLSGEKSFFLKFGNNGWEEVKFTVKPENVRVMPQPMGTLQSVCTTKFGGKILEAKQYFSKNVLIGDPGFGTFDTFTILSGFPKGHETYSDLGMKAVLELLSSKIYKEYGQKIPVPAMQRFLESGNIKVFDKKNRSTRLQNIDHLLKESSEEIAKKAMEKIMVIYNYLVEFDYFIVTGGTGAAWFEFIKDYLKDMTTLKVIKGNQNDESVDLIFANARGYYMSIIGPSRQR